MYRIKKVAGESVVEVMIAMAISAIFVFSAIHLVGRSYGIVGETNKRIEAINLAQEGIELVRNTRDTNWLRYSGNRRANWTKVGTDMLDDTTTAQFVGVGASGNDSIEILEDQSLMQSVYESFATAGSPDTSPGGNTNLDQVSDAWAVKRENYFQLCKNEDGVLSRNCEGTNAQKSPYFRTVKVTAECANGSNCPNGVNISVNSEVFWQEEGDRKFKKTSIKADLYDFYELD